MPTCNDIIDFALRKLAVIPAGRFANPVQADNALTALSSIYEEKAAQGLFGRLTNVRTAEDAYTAHEGERVRYTGAGTFTLTLPEVVTDDETGDDERSPYDLSVIIEAGATPKTWLYDADIGDWVGVHLLTLSSTAPLGSRIRNGLASLLAVRLAPEWGVQVAPQVVVDATSALNTLAFRWSETREAIATTWF